MKLPNNIYERIAHFACFPQTGVSLRQMVKFGQNPNQGTLFKATQFLAEELPVRLAHRVVELEHLPDQLSSMPSVQKVRNWYVESFQELVNLPRIDLPESVRAKLRAASHNHGNGHSEELPPSVPNQYAMSLVSGASNGSIRPARSLQSRYYSSVDDVELPPKIGEYNRHFVKTIENIKRRHDAVVTTLAQGIAEYKQVRKADQIDMSVQQFLDRFLLSRIGIRMLIGQHIAINKQPICPDYVGVICTRTRVAEVAQEAIDNARFICESYYGLFKAPEVKFYCPDNLEFMYVPSHLHHMIFELLKNSLRAVVERFGPDQDEYPDIKIIVAEGREDITIKITDEGGGIPRSALPMVWTYMFTTAQAPILEPDFNQSDFKAPLAGFGYGLPLSKLYARYFGGDLKLISMEGYGTDAYLHLCRLSDSNEPLA